MKRYLQSGYNICGIFGVEGSPTCGAVKTHIKDESGKSVSVYGSGIFFDELEKILADEKMKIDIYDWDIQAKKAIQKIFAA